MYSATVAPNNIVRGIIPIINSSEKVGPPIIGISKPKRAYVARGEIAILESARSSEKQDCCAHKQQIVRSLRNLQDKGIIISDIKSKNSFSALTFEEALKLLIKTEKNQTEMLQMNLLLNWKTMMNKKQSI